MGRPFRQPVDLPDAASHSSGLEIWTHEDEPDRQLFAIFDGELRFIPTVADQPDLLLLDVSAATQQSNNEIVGLLEPVPRRVTYENVDRALVRTLLAELIRSSHEATTSLTQPQWHPIMRTFWRGSEMKGQLDTASDIDAEINMVLDSVMGAPSTGMPLPVVAGDLIGAAAAPLTDDVAPDGCPIAATSRRVTIYTTEYAGNRLNPAFYLWRLLLDAHGPNPKVQVVTRAPKRSDATFEHPLLDALGIDLDVPQLPRVRTPVQMPGQAAPTEVLLFPLGELGDWRGARGGGGESKIEWRIASDASLDFQTRRRSGITEAALAGVDVSPDPSASALYAQRAQQVWSQRQADLNAICTELQFPAEIVAAIIANEAGNDARAVGVEKLRTKDEQALAGHASQNVIDAYKALAPRHELLAPDPWRGTQVIDSDKSTLTWDQLLDLVEHIPHRVSPGLTQTVVESARKRVGWLTGWYQDVAAKFGVAALPTADRDWFTWLLDARHAILAGVAYHKYYYCYLESHMELPRVASLFNRGKTKSGSPIYAARLHDPQIADRATVPNPWWFAYNSLRYPRDASRYYNAVQDVLGAGADARSRLWKSL